MNKNAPKLADFKDYVDTMVLTGVRGEMKKKQLGWIKKAGAGCLSTRNCNKLYNYIVESGLEVDILI